MTYRISFNPKGPAALADFRLGDDKLLLTETSNGRGSSTAYILNSSAYMKGNKY